MIRLGSSLQLTMFCILVCVSGAVAGSDDSPSPGMTQNDIVDPKTQISIFNDYPKIPANYGIVDFRTIAQNYDVVVFNRVPSLGPMLFDYFPEFNEVIKTNKSLPIFLIGLGPGEIAPSELARVSFPKITPFQIMPYINHWQEHKVHRDIGIKTTPRIYGQTVAALPALISSTLLGIDMSNTLVSGEEIPRNLVRMTKRTFHKSDGLFKNLTDVADMYNENVGSFWYDLLPNIQAFQLLSLYSPEKAERGAEPNEQSLEELNYIAADTLYNMTYHLRTVSGGTPDTPNFNFADVRVKSREKWEFTLIPGDWKEPDAAAAVAIIGVMAYERWHKPHHLSMAVWALNFLDKYQGNPYFEILLPYAALAAARLKAQYPEREYSFNVAKILRDCFSASSVRIDHGSLSSSTKLGNSKITGNALGGLWGGKFPVDGLWGPRGLESAYYDGWAYPLNSINQAVVLAPLTRYDTSYAKAIGRYLLNVASNLKMFYPLYLPENSQEPVTVNFLKQSHPIYKVSIPYEGVRHREKDQKGIMHEPYAKGDPVQQKWGFTDLSVYSGAETGYFAAMMIKTSNPYIFMWDLLKTDFQHPNAFPSFLLYNPLSSNTTVSFDLGALRKEYPELAGRVHFYDAVSNLWIGQADAQPPSISLSADSAMVLVVVPDKDYPRNKEGLSGRLIDKSGSTVIDYQ